MNLFPIDLIMEADVRNQNSSSIMAEGALFLKNITMTKGALLIKVIKLAQSGNKLLI